MLPSHVDSGLFSSSLFIVFLKTLLLLLMALLYLEACSSSRQHLLLFLRLVYFMEIKKYASGSA